MAKQLNINMNFTADTKNVENNLNKLKQTLNSMSTKPFTLEGTEKEIKEASSAALQLKTHLESAMNVKTGNIDLSKLQQNLKASGTSVSELSSKLLKSGETGRQAFVQMQRAIMDANLQLTRSSGLLSELATTLKNTVKWQISSSMIHGFMGAIQGAKSYAEDLNKSLTNIQIVTQQSGDEMARFAKQANEAAKKLNTTTTAYTNASLIYAQQGLNEKQIKERADVTMMMSNVTGQSAEEVSSYMTAIWNNFDNGSESLEHYADVITALGAKTASSSKEIAEGLEKFAAISNTVGLSYDYATSALATVVAQTRQSADVVGTAFKTLFARIQDLELGNTLDDGTTLGQYSEALNKVGINIMDTNGEMKDMDIILSEMGAKWDKLSKAQQTALAQNVAGTRQYTQLVALMDNWDKFQANLETAGDAEGALQKQAEVYADSWEGARKRVKASLQGIYNDIIPTDELIKGTNALAEMLNGLNDVINATGGLKTILFGLATVANKVFQKEISQGITNATTRLSTFYSVAKKQGFWSTTKDVYLHGGKNTVQKAKEENRNKIIADANEGLNEALKKYPDDDANLTKEEAYSKKALQNLKQESEYKQRLALVEKEISEFQANKIKNGIDTLSFLQEESIILDKQTESYKEQAKQERLIADLKKEQAESNDWTMSVVNEGPESKYRAKGSIVENSKLLSGKENATNMLHKVFEGSGLSIISAGKEQGRRLLTVSGSDRQVVEAAKHAREGYVYLQARRGKFRDEDIKNKSDEDKKKIIDELKQSGKFYNQQNKLLDKAEQDLSRLPEIIEELYKQYAIAVEVFDFNNKDLESQVKAESRAINSEEKVKESKDNLDITNQNIEDTKQGLENSFDEDSTSRAEKFGQGLSNIADGASQTAMAVSMLSSSIEVLHDSSADGMERLSAISSILMGLPMGIAGISMAAEGLVPIIEMIIAGIKGTETAVVSLETTTIVLGVIAAAMAAIIAAINIIKQKHEEQYQNAKEQLTKLNEELSNLKPIEENTEAYNKNKTAIEEAEKAREKATNNIDKHIQATKDLNEAYDEQVESAKSIAESYREAMENDEALKNALYDEVVAIENNAEALANTTGIDARREAYEKLTNSVNEATIKESEYVIEQSKNTKDTMARAAMAKGREGNHGTGIKESYDYWMRTGAISSNNASKWEEIINEGNYNHWKYLGSGTGQGIEGEANASYFLNSMEELRDILDKASEAGLAGTETYRDLNDEYTQMSEDIDGMIDVEVQNFSALANKKVLENTDGINASNIGEKRKEYINDILKESGYNLDNITEDSEVYKRASNAIDASLSGQEGLSKITQATQLLEDWRKENPGLISDTFDLGELSEAEIDTLLALTSEDIAQAVAEGNGLTKYIQKKTGLEAVNVAATNNLVQAKMEEYKADDDLNKELETRVKLLQEEYEALEENTDAAYKMATAQMMLNEGIKDLITNWQSYAYALANSTGLEKEQTYEKILTDLNNVLGLDPGTLEELLGDKAKNFVNENIEEIEKAISGNAEAIDQIKIDFISEYAKTLNLPEDFDFSKLENLKLEDIAGYDLNDDAINDSQQLLQDYYTAYQEAIKDGNNETAEAYAGLLNKFGFAVSNKEGTTTTPIERRIVFGNHGAYLKETLRDKNKLNELYKAFFGEHAYNDYYNSAQKLYYIIGATEGYDVAENMISSLGGWDSLTDDKYLELLDLIYTPGNGYSFQVEETGGESIGDGTYEFSSSGQSTLQPTEIDPSIQKLIDTQKNKEKLIELQEQEKRNQDEINSRYHTINAAIDKNTKELERLSEAKDKAYGKDKLNVMDSEISKLKESIALNKQYQSQIQSNISSDRSRLQSMASSLGISGVQFNPDGTVSNYASISMQATNKVLNAQKVLENLGDSEIAEARRVLFQSELDLTTQRESMFRNALQQYEQSLSLLGDVEEEYQNKLQQVLDERFEKIKYKAEVKIEVEDTKLKELDYLLEKFNDEAYTTARQITLMTREINYNANKNAALQNEARDILRNGGMTDSEINKFISGGMSTKNLLNTNLNLTEEQMQELETLQESIYNNINEIYEKVKEIFNSITENFSKFQEEMDKVTAKMENNVSIAENLKNILDLTGQSGTAIGKNIIKDLRETTIKNDINLIGVNTAQYLQVRDTIARLRDKFAKATDKKTKEIIKNQIEELESKEEELYAGIFGSWESAISTAYEIFTSKFEDAANEAQDAIAGLYNSLELLSNAIERIDTIKSDYLQDYDRLYNLSKITRDIANSINETKSIKAKQKLLDLQSKIVSLQEKGVKLSKYDVDNLQKQYDLSLALIALEEAQNNKNLVRMQRDNNGNWSYVYTSDQDNIDQAQQKVEDTLNSMVNANEDEIKRLQDEIIKEAQYATSLNQEDFRKADGSYDTVAFKAALVESETRQRTLMNQLENALRNNSQFLKEYNQYADEYGFEFLSEEDLTTKFSDTSLSKTTGFTTGQEFLANYAQAMNKFGVEVEQATNELNINVKSIEKEIKNANIGSNLENIAKKLGIRTEQAQKEAQDAEKNFETTQKRVYQSLDTFLKEWQSKGITSKIQKLETIAGSIDTIASAYANSGTNFNSKINVGDTVTLTSDAQYTTSKNGRPTKSANEDMSTSNWIIDSTSTGSNRLIQLHKAGDKGTVIYVKKDDIYGYATGGYTGDWGNENGKLALLHQKELVLNANDTENFLKIMELLRDSNILSSISTKGIDTNSNQTNEQNIVINADFPNVKNSEEIEKAFNNLVNAAAQYANRKD